MPMDTGRRVVTMRSCLSSKRYGERHGSKHLFLTWTPQAVELPLKISQTAAVMEIVHSIIGLVRSPVMITGALPSALTAEGRIFTPAAAW